jgi:DNA-binding NarL/FixJ family response regulator
MIRVALVDDQELVRAGFRTLIESAEDLEVVGEAANGEEGVRLVREHLPDVVLMDVRMPRVDGIEATKRIHDLTGAEDVRVLVLTTFDLDEYVHEALRAGASGFLLKDASPAELLSAIRVIHEGNALLSPSLTKRLIEDFAQHTRPEKPPARDLQATWGPPAVRDPPSATHHRAVHAQHLHGGLERGRAAGGQCH